MRHGNYYQKERKKKIAEILGRNYDPYDMRSNVVDALTDLRHLCHVLDIDFYDADSSAYYHYSEERAG